MIQLIAIIGLTNILLGLYGIFSNYHDKIAYMQPMVENYLKAEFDKLAPDEGYYPFEELMHIHEDLLKCNFLNKRMKGYTLYTTSFNVDYISVHLIINGIYMSLSRAVIDMSTEKEAWKIYHNVIKDMMKW